MLFIAKFAFQKLQMQFKKEFKKTMKFLRYINKVYHFHEIVKKQKDLRKRRNHETATIFTIVFWAEVLRVRSFNKLEKMLQYGVFNPLFERKTKIPSIDAISETMTKWDIGALKECFKSVIEILFENNTFEEGTIDGYTVCAFDGTNVHTSSKKKCEDCATMKVGKKYYYGHKSIVAMTIGKEINYVLNQVNLEVKSERCEINKKTYEENVITKSEGELTGAKTLIKELPKWVDIIVGDSLYFTAPFFKEVLESGKQAVVRLEDKTRKVYKELMEHVQKDTCDGEWEKEEENTHVSYWYIDTEIEDSNLKKGEAGKYTQIRVYKYIEVIERKIKGKVNYEFKEIIIGTTDKSINEKTILKIIHKRWYIENTCFNQLKSYCNLEHCYRHDPTAIEAILMIMYMVYNLVQAFLFRRLKNFKVEFNKNKETISWQIEKMLYHLVIINFLMKFKLVEPGFIYNL